VSVVVVGIEESNAPLELLERVSVGEDALPKALASLADCSNLSEVIVVSTCLRTEVYAVVERFHDAVDQLVGPGRWELTQEMGWWPTTFPGFDEPDYGDDDDPPCHRAEHPVTTEQDGPEHQLHESPR